MCIRDSINPNNVPIAGIDADGDGTIDAPLTDGLPSMTFYDSNLTDGVGLDSTLGIQVPVYDSALSSSVSISSLLSQLQTETGISFAAGSAGSAVLSVNGEQELSVSISDGMGRTVMVAQVELAAGGLSVPSDSNAAKKGEPDASASGYSSETGAELSNTVWQANTGTKGESTFTSTSSSSSASPRLRVTPSSSLSPITWSYTTYDHTFDLGTVAQPKLVAEVRSIDAFGNITRSRIDRAGRTIQSLDADNNVTLMEYDAGSNMLQVRDPNSVGYDAVYDELGRSTSRTDTHGDTTSTTYNKVGNAVTQPDAKLNVSTSVYDAAGRRTKVKDRLSVDTIYTYDVGSNLLSITDAEGQSTIYAYDDRGLKISTLYPDHVVGSVHGNIGYGIVGTQYDALGRAVHVQDQQLSLIHI